MKVVIVGGVAGGASAAARIRRLDEHAQIIMIERSGYVSYANCGLPYYVGGVIKEQEELTLQTPESFWDRFRIDVRVRQEVTAINPTEKTVTVRTLDSGKIYTETYDKLLLAPGAKPTVPAFSGVDSERVFILSMSQIDVRVEQQYYAPKKGVHDLVHMGSWSNKSGLDEMMDFYDDMLWQSFYAASLSPSYLNRQPYGFLVQDHSIYLVQQEDAYTDNLDAALDLGIVMLHFSAVASQWAGQVRWELSPAAPDGLPEGLRSAAVYHM